MGQSDLPANVGSNEGLGGLVERMLSYSDIRRNDPRENREALRDLLVGELRDELRAQIVAERERMVADGWRKTRYVSPVTVCEACLTEDACQIRGQCAHYLRETPNVVLSGARAEDSEAR